MTQAKVPVFRDDMTAWEGFWFSVGYFIRKLADDRNLTDLIFNTVVVGMVITIVLGIATLIYMSGLDDVEEMRERGVQIQALIEKGATPGYAACVVDGYGPGSHVCHDLMRAAQGLKSE